MYTLSCCTNTHTYMHTHIHTDMHTHIHTDMYTHTHVHTTYTHTHKHEYIATVHLRQLESHACTQNTLSLHSYMHSYHVSP